MAIVKIKDRIHFVGALHPDRELFDEIIPLPDGTSYNSYLVEGSEKTALIDGVEPEVMEQLFKNLDDLKVKKIDYIVCNHAEQDHSGAVPFILEKYKGAKVVTNEKCAGLIKELLLIGEEDIKVIKEGDTLSLGDKTLEFFNIPWVHWPETMATYLREDRVLFPCDFFGSHTASPDLFNEKDALDKAKRYFAEIMYPFRNNVKNNLKKTAQYDVEIIAPSHGIVYRNPKMIIDAYAEWSSDEVKNEVVLAYVSMHHSVKEMADYLLDALVKRGINVRFFNLTKTDLGTLAISLVDAATIVIGTSNFLAGAHPAAVNAAYLINALRPKAKFASVITSYGWGERASGQIKDMFTNIKGEIIEPVVCKGHPKEQDKKNLEILADNILKKHREAGLL